MRIARLFLLALLFLMGASVPGADAGRANTNRSDSLKLLSARLGIGPGDVVADVGCGDGRDSVVFATLVGERGTVLAEEIEPGKLSSVIAAASKKGLHQIVPILGQTDDPRLPDGLANLIYLNLVFHHFSQPQAMLERLWADLKPGGYLVVVDQQKGFLKDWTPMENREKQHHFTAETTVVRLARQAGFLFYSAPEELWHEKEPFVLVFRKPIPPAKHAGEPNPPLPLDPNAVLRSLPLNQARLGAVAFFGLEGGRAVAPALQAKLSPGARFFDVILEEWMLSREELPADVPRLGVEILRTEKGELALPGEVSLDLVLFVDAYHRLWDPVPILRRLKKQMPDKGWVVVADRKGPDTEPRRLAGHQRRISSKLVVEDMRQAGFSLRQTLPAPTKDRFLLWFSVSAPTAASSATGRP